MKTIDLKFVKDWAKRNLVNTQVYCPVLKAYVNFRMDGINHALYYKKEEIRLSVLLNIQEIIKTADNLKIGVVKPKDKNKIKAVFLLSCVYVIEKKAY